MYLAKSVLGDAAELLLEELLKCGQSCPESIIVASCKRLRENAAAATQDANSGLDATAADPAKLYSTFCQMASAKYVERCPNLLQTTGDPLTNASATVPTFAAEEEGPDCFEPPNLNLKKLREQVEKGEVNDKDSSALWRVNFARFHQEFRDQVIVTAVTRRIDASAGHLMKTFLKQVDNAKSGDTSNHIYLISVMEEVNSVNCTDVRLRQFREHYLKVLEEDRTRFLDRVGNESGGIYTINFKHISAQLATATVENVVMEKFSTRALRIFRHVAISFAISLGFFVMLRLLLQSHQGEEARRGVPDPENGDDPDERDQVVNVPAPREQLYSSARVEKVVGQHAAVQGLLSLLRRPEPGKVGITTVSAYMFRMTPFFCRSLECYWSSATSLWEIL
jgi:hypothetical protein